MNKQYLLDANDAFKKLVFEWLRSELRCLQVIPMITDNPSDWTCAEWDLYADLFGVPNSNVLAQNVQFKNNRSNTGIHGYFSNLLNASPPLLCASADLFVDPDTGLTDSGGGKTHINAAEVAASLHSDRVVIIYQHANRNSTTIPNDLNNHRRSVEDKMTKQTVHAFGIAGTSICLFFFSLNRMRLICLSTICNNNFGPMANNRVIPVIPVIP